MDFNRCAWTGTHISVQYIDAVYRNILGHMLGTNIERNIRNDLYGHIQKLSFRFFDNTKTGKLLTRLTNDLMNIGEMAHHGPEDLFIAIMTLLGAFGIMYYIHPELAIIAFIIVPLILVIAIYFNKKMT